MRAYWKGHLRLSHVTIAVELHAVTESAARPELHQIDKKTGKRIRYEKIVPGKGPVDTENMVKGFELGSGKHVILTPEELDKIKLETKARHRSRPVRRLLRYRPAHFERPYYLGAG